MSTEDTNMINIFLNEEYGLAHWWWEHPGTLDDLIIDWNTGNAPFLGKPYQGTMTIIPRDSDPDNPFAAVTAGRRGTYTICRPGEDPEEKTCISMDNFFDATGEVVTDNPYLRIGEDIYPAPWDLLESEEEVADKFNWADWTEDPPYYYQWFENWKTSYDCGQDRSVEIKAASEGRLSPQKTDQISNHLSVCQGCKAFYKTLR